MKTLRQTLLTILGLFSLIVVHAQTARWTNNQETSFLRPQLTGFTAVEKNDTVSLNWATSCEKQSAYFIVERSRDGIQFDSVGAVTAIGRFDLPTSYEFTDLQPVAGRKFYRLRVVDLDGRKEYWKVFKAGILKEVSESDKAVVSK